MRLCPAQHGDEYANDKNEIQLGLVAGTFKWGVWVNTSKNPRLKVCATACLLRGKPCRLKW